MNYRDSANSRKSRSVDVMGVLIIILGARGRWVVVNSVDGRIVEIQYRNLMVDELYLIAAERAEFAFYSPIFRVSDGHPKMDIGESEVVNSKPCGWT